MIEEKLKQSPVIDQLLNTAVDELFFPFFNLIINNDPREFLYKLRIYILVAGIYGMHQNYKKIDIKPEHDDLITKVNFSDVEFEKPNKALEFFAKKIPNAKSKITFWNNLAARGALQAWKLLEKYKHSFWMTSVESLNEIIWMKNKLSKYLQGNKSQSPADIKKELHAKFPDGELEKLSLFRLETIARTNLMSSYNEAKHEILEDKDYSDHVKVIRIDTICDKRVRPTHRFMNGFIAPPDDPIWKIIGSGTAGFNCRCSHTLLTESECEDLNLLDKDGNVKNNNKLKEQRKLVLENKYPDPGFLTGKI